MAKDEDKNTDSETTLCKSIIILSYQHTSNSVMSHIYTTELLWSTLFLFTSTDESLKHLAIIIGLLTRNANKGQLLFATISYDSYSGAQTYLERNKSIIQIRLDERKL